MVVLQDYAILLVEDPITNLTLFTPTVSRFGAPFSALAKANFGE